MGDQKIKPPILFIAQNKEPNPEKDVQSFYYSKNPSTPVQVEEENTTESNTRKKNRFQNMSMEEKLEYLTNIPTILPKMKCKIITNETSYNCFVDNYNGDSVYIHFGNISNKKKIDKQSIQEILLIGF